MIDEVKKAKLRSDKIERRGLMAALDASQSLVWFDKSGSIVDVNDNALCMFGYLIDEMLRLNYFDLIKVTDRNEPANLRHWQRICDGALKNEERSVYSMGGSEIWSSISYAAIRPDEGPTRRILALVIDLSPWSWKPKDAERTFGAI